VCVDGHRLSLGAVKEIWLPLKWIDGRAWSIIFLNGDYVFDHRILSFNNDRIFFLYASMFSIGLHSFSTKVTHRRAQTMVESDAPSPLRARAFKILI
jgi:hypothetical protein